MPSRRMNGDQVHQGRHVRVPGNGYSIQHVNSTPTSKGRVLNTYSSIALQ